LVPGSVYHPLNPVETFLHGWSAINPGFERSANAQGGVNPLSAEAQIWLKVVSLDTALFVIDDAFNVLDSPGQMAYLGSGTSLHKHLTWFIDRTAPGFDPVQCVWEGTFVLTDTGSGLDESLPFTLLFANVPVRGGQFPPTPVSATGDFDDDNNVDRDDWTDFTMCMAGPQQRPQPNDFDIVTCEVDCYNAFGFDNDLDVDLRDAAAFQRVYDP